MPEEQKNEETVTEEVVEGQASETDAKETGGTETSEQEEEVVEGDESNDLEYWKSEAKKARSEAAARRVANRDMEAKIKDAKSPEDVAAIVKDFEGKLLAKDKEVVAERYKLPEELAELLKGDTPEELVAHAKKLAKFAPAEQEADDADESGGLTPKERRANYSTTDPAELRKLMSKKKPEFVF